MLTQITGFDFKDALERFSGNTAMLQRYINLLFTEFETHLPPLVVCVQKSQWQTIQETLHALKGASTCMSAVKLSTLCVEGEQACRSQDAKALLLVLSEIQSYLTLNRPELN